jgi:hypothetical protein
MSKIIHLVLSDNFFGGFEHFFQLTPNVDNIDEMINSIINKLKETLIYNKLENALILLKKTQFHIHGVTLEKLRKRHIDDIVYVCNHC